jgi:hypothetical protein
MYRFKVIEVIAISSCSLQSHMDFRCLRMHRKNQGHRVWARVATTDIWRKGAILFNNWLVVLVFLNIVSCRLYESLQMRRKTSRRATIWQVLPNGIQFWEIFGGQGKKRKEKGKDLRWKGIVAETRKGKECKRKQRKENYAWLILPY